VSILAICSVTDWIRELSGMAPMGILFAITTLGAAIFPYIERSIAIAVFKGTDVVRPHLGRGLCAHGN
jgi:hypothetical protein